MRLSQDAVPRRALSDPGDTVVCPSPPRAPRGRHATLGSLGETVECMNAWPTRRMPGITRVTKVARFMERACR